MGEHEGLPFDEILDAMSHVRRRELLFALLAKNPRDPASLIDAEDESEREVMEFLVQMRHVHLPKLEEYGIIQWDREGEEVVKGPKFDEIRPLLELLRNHEGELPGGWL